MRVAVIGAGGVGRTLEGAWTRAGHAVRFGVRSPSDYPDLAQAQPIPDCIRGADVVVIAIPGAGIPDLLSEHAAVLDGCLLIDASNTMGGASLHQVPLLTATLPSARIARAFCTVGIEVMAEPVIDGEIADLVWCGPEGNDAGIIEQLIRDVGLRPIRVGGLESASVVEGATRLWFALAFALGYGRHTGMRILSSHTP